MEKPLVSVIMPVYNTKQWVWEAIESILRQTLSNFEFIIVDDCSTDGSYEVCEEYAKKDKRIRLYRNEKNEGISYTRNKLILLTNTDYIACQDSDDISLPSRLQLEYDFLIQNPDYWVVSWNNEIIDEKGDLIFYRLYSNNISSTILKENPVSNPTTMFRKPIFLEVWGYEKWLNYGEDYDLRLKFYVKWYKIKNLKDFLLKYRIREGQTKSNHLKQLLKNTILLQKKYAQKGINASLWDKIFWFCESILLRFPTKLIHFLFKKITYKNF